MYFYSPLALDLENVFPFPAVDASAIPWDFILILTVLGILVPWRSAIRVKHLLSQPALSSAQRLSLYGSTIAFQWLFSALVAWRAFSRNVGAQELGLTVADPWRTALIAVILTVLLCANQWISLSRIAKIPVGERGFLLQFREKIMPQTSAEALVFVVLACTAGLSEEFLYRGFVFAVFTRSFANFMFSRSITAAVISSAWFGAAHLYQGRRGVVTTFVVGMLFAGVRIWSGSLAPSMAAHIGIDLIAGLGVSRFPRAA